MNQEPIPAPSFHGSLVPHTPPLHDQPAGTTSPVPQDILGITSPVPFSWQARAARELHDKQTLHHEAAYSGELRSRHLLPGRGPEPCNNPQDAPDVFEDGVAPVIVESDCSGSDHEFQPELTPKAREPREEHSDSDTSNSLPPLTAKQKGKGKQAGRNAGPEELAAPNNSIDGRGRLLKATIASFREFGETTRQRAQQLADLHHVNLATVMKHASLGAGTEVRAPNDCNTFKSIYSAESLAETGGTSFSLCS